jgi:RNA polymerase sigma-70 factor, ECF subfamily
MAQASEVAAAVDAAYKREHGQVVATLIRATADWELAEDSAQEALARALETWPRDGIPRKPGAWLVTVARRYAIDRRRREMVGLEKQLQAFDAQRSTEHWGSTDDRLDLLFTCCHPALAIESQVALTLRSLSGLSTAQIASTFLVSEATMSRRLVRAKQKIREAGIPFRVPSIDAMEGRLAAVLGVLYLIFNAGYDGNAALRAEAIELTAMLDTLMPDEPEVLGLLALMHLQAVRAAERGLDAGAIVPLDEQDRSQWDAGLIDEGRVILDRAVAFRSTGSYQIQAAIAACHVTAPTFEQTDWAQITALYELLADLLPSPIVQLNRAVAVAMGGDPDEALRVIDSVEPELESFYLLPATKADIARRRGSTGEARLHYLSARELAPTDAARAFFDRRIAEVSAPILSG